MKAVFPKSARAILAALPVLLVAGCETTGDPNSGGIFWSEQKAQYRQDVLRSELNRQDAENARQLRTQRQLENQL